MKIIYVVAIALILLPLPVVALAFAPIWTYDINVVQFVESDPTAKTDKPAPNIWIDTHIEISGLFGGTIKSVPPYDVTFDYTDDDRLYASAEITSVTITYDDKAIEKATDKLKLPLRMNAREHESFNSMTGGEIVKNKYMLLMGRIPGVITREVPFTLKLKGHFMKHDGTKVPFEFDGHYDVEKETGQRSWAEVMSSV